jgi:hypothetical protein
MIRRVACKADSYILFHIALILSRIAFIAHVNASFLSSLISRGVNSRFLCHFFFFRFRRLPKALHPFFLLQHSILNLVFLICLQV